MTTTQNIYIDLGTTSGVNLTPSIDISNLTIHAQFSKYFYSQQKFSFDVSVNDGIINLNYSGDKSGRYVYYSNSKFIEK